MGVSPNDGGLEYGGDVMGLDSSWQPNATHLTYVDNSTILATIAVPREFAVPERDDHPFEITSPLSFSAFADNASLPINLKVTATASILYHLEEVPTGITRRFADEDGLRTAPPAELSGDGSGWVNEPDTAEVVGWFPNLVAQTQRQVEAQALDAAPTHTLEIHLENDAWVDAGADYDVGSGGRRCSSPRSCRRRTRRPAGTRSSSRICTRPTTSACAHLRHGGRRAAAGVRRVRDRAPRDDRGRCPPRLERRDPRLAAGGDAGVGALGGLRRPPDHHHADRRLGERGDRLWERDRPQHVEEGVTHQLTLSLDGDAWVDAVGDAGSDLNVAIVRGLTSSSDEVSGWNRVVQNALAFLAATQSIVTRVSALDVRIDVPFISGYDITRADVVSVTVPAAALATNMTTTGASFAVMPSPSACTLEFGGVAETPNAAGLRTSSLVLRLSLINDAWVAGDGGAAGVDAATARLILGSVESQTSEVDEPNGWNAVVRPALLAAADAGDLSALARPAGRPHTIEITVEAQPTYAIAVLETLVVTLPAAVLMTGSEVVAAPSASCRRRARRRSTCGTGRGFDDACTEAQVRTGSAATIVLTLTDDEWVDDDDDGADWSDTDDEVREAVLRAILSAQVDEEAGWNALVLPAALASADVTRESPTVLSVALPAVGGYAIATPETITARCPPPPSSRAARRSRPARRRAGGAAVFTGGALHPNVTDARVRAPPALDALIVLDGDEFLPAIGLDGADTDRLLAGVVSSASEDDEPAAGRRSSARR